MGFENVFDSSLVDYSKGFEESDMYAAKFVSKFDFLNRMSDNDLITEIIKYYWNYKYNDKEISEISDIVRDYSTNDLDNNEVIEVYTIWDGFTDATSGIYYPEVLHTKQGGCLFNIIQYWDNDSAAQEKIIAALLEMEYQNVNIGNLVFGENHPKSTLRKLIEECAKAEKLKLIDD